MMRYALVIAFPSLLLCLKYGRPSYQIREDPCPVPKARPYGNKAFKFEK